ncbi:hypothetical protein GCM10010234_11650 [Streptomyces hawaiiensis]|uniref:hypothetical protein n=1 Tax=Streptomyces hawaiiensis TaxID=67305 RepID=UPI0031D3E514
MAAVSVAVVLGVGVLAAAVLAESGAANATDSNAAAATFQYVETTRDPCLTMSPSVLLRGAEVQEMYAAFVPVM